MASFTRTGASRLAAESSSSPRIGPLDPERVVFLGRIVCLAGVFLPLFWIGIKKFTHAEVESVEPLIAATPWIAWLPRVFGDEGASYVLGAVEVPTSLLFIASPWFPRAGVLAGASGTLTFAVTSSILTTFPIWNPASGGFPWISTWGAFLIKDVALLGISVVILGESWNRVSRSVPSSGRRA